MITFIFLMFRILHVLCTDGDFVAKEILLLTMVYLFMLVYASVGGNPSVGLI